MSANSGLQRKRLPVTQYYILFTCLWNNRWGFGHSWFFPPSINVLFFSYFCFLSPDSICLDNLPDQLWCCLAMCISSGVAVFSDFLHDFFDYSLHKFLYSGKNNINQLFLAFCWLWQKDMLKMSFCNPSLTCICSWSTMLIDQSSTFRSLMLCTHNSECLVISVSQLYKKMAYWNFNCR